METSLREKAVQSFDSLGQTGPAEVKTAKRFERARALGLIAFKSLTVIGALTVAGGVRQEGFSGALKAGFNAVTSVGKNSNGEWDFPFVDFNREGSSISIESNSGSIAVSTAVEQSTNNGAEIGTATSVAEGDPQSDRQYAEGNLADCDPSATPAYEEIEKGEIVYGLVLERNPGVTTREAALNIAFNEFMLLNPDISDPSNIPEKTSVLIPTACTQL